MTCVSYIRQDETSPGLSTTVCENTSSDIDNLCVKGQCETMSGPDSVNIVSSSFVHTILCFCPSTIAQQREQQFLETGENFVQ